jgi:hypothetical protein
VSILILSFNQKLDKIKKKTIIILPLVLNECESRSLTRRQERRLRMLVNRVLRKKFGPMRDKVKWE